MRWGVLRHCVVRPASGLAAREIGAAREMVAGGGQRERKREVAREGWKAGREGRGGGACGLADHDLGQAGKKGSWMEEAGKKQGGCAEWRRQGMSYNVLSCCNPFDLPGVLPVCWPHASFLVGWPASGFK